MPQTAEVLDATQGEVSKNLKIFWERQSILPNQPKLVESLNGDLHDNFDCFEDEDDLRDE